MVFKCEAMSVIQTSITKKKKTQIFYVINVYFYILLFDSSEIYTEK